MDKERRKRAEAHAKWREQKLANDAVQLADIEANMQKAVEAFEEMFTWEERRVLQAAAYWSARWEHCQATGTPLGSVGVGIAAGAKAARVHKSTSGEWQADWRANSGYFSLSLWGNFPKGASMCGDVETRAWMRGWVIENMGHRRGQRNKTNADFNKALHHYLNLSYDPDNLNISMSQSLAALNRYVGARYMPVKQGSVHHDNHGADHVVNYQRPAFLSLHKQIHDRGPNYVKLRTGWILDEYIDKDEVPNLVQSSLLNKSECIGPRGINMGGAIKPNVKGLCLPFARTVDHPRKVWHTLCHDECCIHALGEEGGMWIIPGVDMGDCPSKSRGDINHLAEADAEFAPGCLSLDGEIGQTERKTMMEYYKQRQDPEKNPRIPLHSSISMHAGAGHEGSWMGDDALAQSELLMDQFDVLFNLVDKVPDPTAATANDVRHITNAERSQFKHGMCMQVDQSQGHLKRAADSLNTNNGINVKPGRKQAHFRHTFCQLPAGFSHWRECREALCQPNCAVCQAAVDKYGHMPNFQSCGKKGSRKILTEMGIPTAGLAGPAMAKLLNQQPNWGQTKSQLQELFESRGHFLLIGVACHPELASKEHGWARLKQKVKPEVTGNYSDLRVLVLAAAKQIGQQARLEDSRRTREVMAAYRSLAAAGEEATTEGMELWKKKHKKHRGVHISEISDLQKTVGMEIAKSNEKTLKKMQTEAENKSLDQVIVTQQKKRLASIRRRRASKKVKADPIAFTVVQANNKKRKDEWKASHKSYKRKRRGVSKKDKDKDKD